MNDNQLKLRDLIKEIGLTKTVDVLIDLHNRDGEVREELQSRFRGGLLTEEIREGLVKARGA